MQYEGKADLRITSPQSNAGAHKAITVTTAVANDLAQWSNVPYYQDALSDSVSASTSTDIDKVYLSNDANNLYIRIKNKSGSLPGFNTAPRFGMMVYAEDFKNGAAAAKSTGMYGGALDRPFQYLVGRWSDGNNLSKFNVQSGNWTFTNHISGVIIPQWSTTSGDMEMVIPFSQLSSSAIAVGDWANLNIVLVRQAPSTFVWSEDDVAVTLWCI